MIRLCVLPLTLLWLLLASCAAPTPETLYDLQGRPADPLTHSDDKATVFLFTRTDCPISNRYAPEVRRLHESFSGRGVAFYLIYPDPGEAAETIRAHLEEYGYLASALRDPGHVLVKKTGAQVTPEAAVFDAGGRLVYRGRIDDRWVSFGKPRPEPTTRDLADVLERLVAGETVEPRTTTAIGCFISDLS